MILSEFVDPVLLVLSVSYHCLSICLYSCLSVFHVALCVRWAEGKLHVTTENMMCMWENSVRGVMESFSREFQTSLEVMVVNKGREEGKWS